MNKLYIAIALLLTLLCMPVFAETIDISDITDKAPEVKEGYLYSIDDAKGKVSSSFDLISKNDLALELGAITADDEIFLAVSYHLTNLKDDWNVKVWLLDLVDINIAVGYGLQDLGENNEGDILIGCSLIKWKI